MARGCARKKIASVEKPTSVTHAYDGSRRLFITEQTGRIVIVKDNKQLNVPLLDISKRVSCCGERGLLSVAFLGLSEERPLLRELYGQVRRHGGLAVSHDREPGSGGRCERGNTAHG